MDPFQAVLDLAVPPSAILFLITIWPLLMAFRFFSWIRSILFMEDIRDKVVIITGASSGIGEHVAYEYAKRGATLILIARRENLLHEVAERCRGFGSKEVRIAIADVNKEEDCRKFVEETVNQYGRLDHLVNNAGVGQCYLFEEATDPKNFAPIVDTTFWGNIYPTYYALPHLKKSRGKIVANSSTASWLPYPRMAAYNAAKAGLFHFYETLRVECGTEVGITIITPGLVESELSAGKFIGREGKVTVSQEARDMLLGPTPVVHAEDCARAIVYGALQGKKYVQVPKWYSAFLAYRVLVPELLDWCMRLMFLQRAPFSEVPPAKLMLDISGTKDFLYPDTIKHPEAIQPSPTAAPAE